MLAPEILQALKQYTATIDTPLNLVMQTGTHPKRDELKQFLLSVASVSDFINVIERDTYGAKNALRSPVSFLIEVAGKDSGIRFSGIPSGHEFNSLVLALLHSSGTEIKLDDVLKRQIRITEVPMHFEIFVSLSCHNCPDVVQSINQFALLNNNIRSEMIDGGLFPELVDERNIQGVPSVYLNGELFANGKMSTSDLIEKLIVDQPDRASDEQSTQLPLQDVVVIGGGPAGISSAIYSARKGLKVTLVADRLGGQVKDTMGIENLISVSSTTGPELTGALHTHLSDYDVTLKEHLRVVKVNDGDIKSLSLSSGEIIFTKTLIIATGAKWRELGVPGEKENVGNGVAYCPHCDGPFFKDKDVAVVGGGNSGIEAALDLSGIAKSVTVFEFLPELKADKVLVDQANKRENIEILTSVATKSIKASTGKVNAIEYIERNTEHVHQRELEGVFVQIGLVPNSHFIGDIVETTDYGEIKVNEKCETSSSGIYACGDVSTVPYKQIVIAMGEGAKASLASFEYLLANNDRLDNLYADLLNEDRKIA